MAHDILIVDDEPDIRMLVEGILSDEGYDTRQAVDQLVSRSSTRSLDLFAQMFVSQTMSLRVAASMGVQQFGPPNGVSTTQLGNGEYTRSERYAKPQLNVSLDMRL
jgi:CheY-like chemotaxis protein